MKKDLHIVEGVNGYWHYHLAKPGENTPSLCGAWTMATSIPLNHWGLIGGEHLPKQYTYCKECEQLAGGK